MKVASNKDVIHAWYNGNEAEGLNLTTDGAKLYSYALMIGDTIEVDSPYNRGERMKKKLILDYTKPGGRFKSATTSKHIRLAIDLVYSHLVKPIDRAENGEYLYSSRVLT